MLKLRHRSSISAEPSPGQPSPHDWPVGFQGEPLPSRPFTRHGEAGPPGPLPPDSPSEGESDPHNGRNLLALLVGIIVCAALGVGFGFGIQALRQARSEPSAKPTVLSAGTPFVVGTPEITRFGSSATAPGGQSAVPSADPAQTDPTAVREQPGSSVSIPGKPNFYLPEVSSAGLSDLERSMLGEVNARRASAGLPSLALDTGLTKIA